MRTFSDYARDLIHALVREDFGVMPDEQLVPDRFELAMKIDHEVSRRLRLVAEKLVTMEQMHSEQCECLRCSKKRSE